MEVIDNINKTLRDDLSSEIKPRSKVSIAAAVFSIYAYQELKAELEQIDALRFLFTAPTFVTEKANKEKRKFYIKSRNYSREKSLFGTEYEIKLRNELSQKAIAKECADWIRSKVTFKSNISNENMSGFLNVDNVSYAPINGFTTVDLGSDRGNNAYYMINKIEAPFSSHYLKLFEDLWHDRNRLKDVTEEVLENISTAYSENSPEFLYYFTLFNIFSEFLEDISEDELPNEATGFKDSKIWGTLFNFQRDAAISIINKLERYNGCILADSVGLGKTFTALAVIKYYEDRNKSTLVLCPKKLSNNWNTFKDNYVNNPIVEDRLNYDVLYHTDLSRASGESNGLDLGRLNWSNYDLVVIDESHNFRNGGKLSGETGDKENRYSKLLNQVIRKGVKTKVLMLSATPVNNRFSDLRNQLQLAYEGDPEKIDGKLNTSKSVNDIFKQAQTSYNRWITLPPEKRTMEHLLEMLDFDFFEMLDSVTIARSRKHIEKYYDTKEIGTFPSRLKPISLRPGLTDLEGAVTYNEIYEQLNDLNLAIYMPTHYIHPSRLYKYVEDTDKADIGLTQKGREQGIRRLMAINLMKRMESSVHSFALTLRRIQLLNQTVLHKINTYAPGSTPDIDLLDFSDFSDFDEDDQENEDFFSVGRKVKIKHEDMDYLTWGRQLAADMEVLELLDVMIQDITPEHDSKLQLLKQVLANKMENPINPGNKKVLIFSAFADTTDYLYEHISHFMKENYGLDTAMVTGSVEGRSTIKGLPVNLNTVLTCFSPEAKDKDLLMPNNSANIDILIATDCISEGQNLQDCDYVINYDIHWNPVRIIQRFGRVDRIGSHNDVIQLVNFWPDITLDEYINLKARVETRMKIVDMTATGDDNILSPEEKNDLEYRKNQLQRLQDEVVDLEEMTNGVSITDLGLNEFRLDLLEYVKQHDGLDDAPYGLHAIIPAMEGVPTGVIFILENRTSGISISDANRLHPFYLVYISDDGETICNHLEPKKVLDILRLLCSGQNTPHTNLCQSFNEETDDGKSMQKYSALLGKAISSIIDVKDESDIDSLFSRGGTTALNTRIKGLDDFELICFFVVREGNEQ